MTVPFQPPPTPNHPPIQRAQQAGGLLPAILDPDFETFVIPRYIAGAYRGYLIFSALCCSVWLMFLVGFRGWIGPYLLAIGIGGTLSAWYMGALAMRMAGEYLVILFKIHGEIADFHQDMRQG